MKKIFFFLICGMVFKPSKSQKPNDYFLFPFKSNVTVPAGSKLNFEIRAVNDSGITETITSDMIGAEWTINGQPTNPSYGKLNIAPLNKTKAIYTAPDKAPDKNPVAIAVSFIADNDRKTKVTLICNVTITDVRNYFFIDKKGLFQLNDMNQGDMEARMAMAIIKEGQLVISVNGMTKGMEENAMTSIMSMTIMTDGTGLGDHSWKVAENGIGASTVALSYINGEGTHFTFASGDCLPHGSGSCQTITLSGTTFITEYNTSTGIVKGFFSGTTMTANPVGMIVQYEYENVYGKFTAHIMDVPGN
jgi:hypothetical protein